MGPPELKFAPAPELSSQAAYQEAFGNDGAARAHWQYVLDSLTGLGEAEFAQRRQTLERILRDKGAT